MLEENYIGNCVKEARVKYGKKITQTNLSEKMQTKGVDIDNAMISRIESGDREMSVKELLALCEVLNVTPNQILKYPKQY